MTKDSTQTSILEKLVNSEVARAAGPSLDGGVLALAMWMLDPVYGGGMVGHVRLERDAHDKVIRMRGLQVCYEHQPRFGQWLSWNRHGVKGPTMELLEGSEHGFNLATDVAIYVHPDNVTAFLREAGMPDLDESVLAALIGQGRAQRLDATEMGASFRSREAAGLNLTEAPFSDRGFLAALIDGAGSPEIREAIVQSEERRTEVMEIAITRDRPDLVGELLDRGYAIDAVDPDTDDRPFPIHKAGSSPEVTRLLLNRGASVESLTLHKRTPLHLARQPEVVQALLALGADFHALDERGHTPLHHLLDLAQKTDFADSSMACIRALMAGGADPFHAPVDVRADYLTPFQLAVRKGWTRLVEYFVSSCAVDLAQRTRGGKTLAQLAGTNVRMRALLRSAKTGEAVQNSLRAADAAPGTSSSAHPPRNPDRFAL